MLQEFDGINGPITAVRGTIPLLMEIPLGKRLAGERVDIKIVGVSTLRGLDETKLDARTHANDQRLAGSANLHNLLHDSLPS